MMVTERQQLLDTLQTACKNVNRYNYVAVKAYFAAVDAVCDYAKANDDIDLFDDAMDVMCGGDSDESD
jgi:hypothetical protein